MKATDNVNVKSVMMIMSNGDNEICEHSWVYDKPHTTFFTVPAKFRQQRICEHCGRLEDVEIENRMARYDMTIFESLKESF